MDIQTTYKTIWNITRLKHVLTLIAVLFTCKIAFAAHEAATGMKLIEKGLKKEDLALAVLVDFPLEIFFGYLAAKWSSGPRPLKPWLWSYYGKLLGPLIAVAIVSFMPNGAVTNGWYLIVLMAMISSSFMSTVAFVSQGAFFAQISDPAIGGTYMTVNNLHNQSAFTF